MNEQFEKTLRAAVNGDNAAIEAILEQFAPLLNANSIINGKFDEDLHQHLILHIIKKIKKFKI